MQLAKTDVLSGLWNVFKTKMWKVSGPTVPNKYRK